MSKEYMLSSPQHNVWIQEQHSGRPEMSTVSVNMRIGSRLDFDMLEQAANLVVRHHEGLRLRFSFREGEALQQVTPYQPFSCARRRVESDEALGDYLEERGRTPFSLYREALIDFELLEVGDGACCVNYRAHHIIVDAYSAAALCSRILAAYRAISRGEEGSPEWPEGGYFDYIEEEQKYAQSVALIEDREYWKNTLRNFAPFRRIGTADGGGDRFRLGRYRHAMDRELTQRVEAFAAEHGLTPYIVLMTAYAVYLSKICDTSDVAVATARLNRDNPKERDTFGLYVTTVPIRMELDGCADFLEACRLAAKRNREASRHKRIGYSCILDVWKRGGGSGALTDFTLSFQSARVQGAEDFAPELAFSPAGAASTGLALHVDDWSGRGCYQLTFDYREADFREGEVEAFCQNLLVCLRGCLEHPEAALHEISLITPGEQERLLAEQEGNALDYDRSQTIVSLFQSIALKYPDKTALTATGGALTFDGLDKLSDRFCSALLRHGVEPGDIVAFLLPRNLELIPIMLGILKAGCAFLPLDYSFPAERIKYIVEDSGAKALLTTVGQPVGDLACQLLTTVDLQGVSAQPRYLPEVGPEDLCYIIYTSGTTGRPKGVMVEHRGIVNFVQPDNNDFNRDVAVNGRGIVAVGSICFDISLSEIFVALLNGVPVVLADAQQMSNPIELAGLMTEHDTNIFHCTPSRLLSYLEEPSFAKALSGTDIILTAGEPLTRPLFNLLRASTNARVYNGYGPTEATIGATVGWADETLNLGKPIANSRVYILDRNQNMLPLGVAGEIAIGGDGLARGYVGDEALTRERFVDFLGRRVYRTGDLGYRNPDGTLGFAGRMDDQVKLRGMRVEPGEIERCILSGGEVEQAAVLVLNRESRQHLCCFYTGWDGDPDRLKAAAAAFLPAYMVPELFVRLEAMPLTVGGKIDRQALAGMNIDRERAYAPPETELETLLCDVFAEVLELETVGAADDFFEIGGTSLLASRVLLAAKKRGVTIPFEALFRHTTPRALGQNLGAVPMSAEDDIARYDYTEIHALLAQNANYRPGKPEAMESVLLTGSTGYLGIHILAELLARHHCKVYCLVRSKSDFSAETRLRGALFYYFENRFGSLFRERLVVMEGDLANPELFSEGQEIPAVDTVINCATHIARLSQEEGLDTTDTKGVRHLIDFCRRQNARLIQISTVGVGGFLGQEEIDQGATLSESSLYLGQKLDNDYLRGKFLAEREVLEAAANQGLRVKIMRVGNLQGRMSDGTFLMNLTANDLTRLLQSLAHTGRCPEGMLGERVSFSPVDYVVGGIVRMISTNSNYTVFHVGCSATIENLLRALEEIGHTVEVIPDAEFGEFMDYLSQSKEGRQLADGFMARFSSGSELYRTPWSSAFTAEALGAESFTWPEITLEYIKTNLIALENMGFLRRP